MDFLFCAKPFRFLLAPEQSRHLECESAAAEKTAEKNEDEQTFNVMIFHRLPP
jgi:hypothetical protein